jgi:hypothetical protein
MSAIGQPGGVHQISSARMSRWDLLARHGAATQQKETNP